MTHDNMHSESAPILIKIVIEARKLQREARRQLGRLGVPLLFASELRDQRREDNANE